MGGRHIDASPLTVLFLPDELIRAVTIQCSERGLLLLKVRDDIRRTVAAHQTLYESGMFFGVRRTLLAEVDGIDRRKTVRTSRGSAWI